MQEERGAPRRRAGVPAFAAYTADGSCELRVGWRVRGGRREQYGESVGRQRPVRCGVRGG